ncbi:MAG: tetratricopeptide repeat protein [Candidatus Cardinium sp.]|uniref:tetratricopeptide repeat protein n=1 Tax=Cardinium endosymbiont of Dermatophagoides farinae TaxID=2597823 RepID=UPI0016429263|nr:tetratricopeptide repeat protein [Cardinium endosymbiont of Dermatophagoides farinae]UWW97329.1 MAG: tetratricopeptide repeat protein [Candidatus Cardinium sp.]
MQPIYSVILMAILLMAAPYKGFSSSNRQPGPFPEAIFHEGKLLFDQHQYTTAQKYFETYLNSHKYKKYKKEEASYYIILAALANKDPHIAILLQYFIVRYATSAYVETVRYHLAKCFSEAGLFEKSIALYRNIKADCLAPQERAALPYATGAVYLQLKDWENAKKHFTTINDTNHPYYYPAQLQIGYIAFEEGDYDGALAALEKASKKYSLETKSLILKVNHKAGRFESLVDLIERDPDSSFVKQDQLLIADAYFFLKQYQAAIIHYQAALNDRTNHMTRTKLGHALYETQQYTKAIACFQGLLHREDHSGQIAAYYSGLIYEKDGAIPAAIAAFSQAERLKFDPKISDLAAIKLAGLRYQQGAIPEAIEAMAAFIESHQDSKELSTAQALLIQCYYKTKAYQTVIDYIARLPYKTEALLKLYQKVLFCQGLAAYNKGTLDDAIKWLKQSLLFPFKSSLVLQAQFWLGEAFSALGKYEKALKFYTKYMEQGSLNTLYYEKNLYGLAYGYFNTGHYTTAAKFFEQYIAITQKQPAATHYDAILRLADCYYVKKNYEEALNLYARMYTYNPAHVRYQEALIYQTLGDNLRSERCLQEIFTNHIETKYYEKACYHKGCTIFNAGNYEAAIQSFSYLMQREGARDLQPDLLMKRALAYENLQKYEAAAADYTAILDEYPNHLHAESALMALSKLFTDTPEKLDFYLKKYTHVAQKMASQSDERTIDAARQLFYNQAYGKVLQQLTAFDKQYPDSQVLSEAYFLMAESYYRLQKSSQAISYYKKVVAARQTTFHKKAWLRMADLAEQGKRFQEAVTYYQKLQKMQLTDKEYHHTLIGLIKASFAIKQYQITTPACLQLLNSTKEAPIETMGQAALYLGKIAMQRSEYKRARSHFLKATKPLHTITAAEAQYLLAHTEFKLKAYKASLNILFDLVEKFPHNTRYIDHAFLLMADNYIMLGNLAQAKATLDSMISKSNNKKNIELAKQKRAKVVAKIKKKQ